MKQVFLAFALILVASAGFSQASATAAPAPSADMAVAAFDSQNFDFGKIKQGVPATHEFTFTNTGNVPLIITSVQASCGCTTPAYSQMPIPPGQKGFIKATYNAASAGTFNKSVTVTANVEGGQMQLIIRGEVQANVQPQ